MNLGHKGVRYIIILLVPLVLSAYTHLWNPLGFPSFHIDEAHYMRRAMLVIQGMGPQESAASGYPRTYDHPYFGQIFLAGALSLIGYPNVLHPVSDQNSIEAIHLMPRVLMGFLAIIDTLLIFKISERRYGTTVALIAAVLFAVMPMTWMLRRVYLDTLLIPFIMSSILFAMWLRPSDNVSTKSEVKSRINQGTLILVSGIFLGLAIYTKAPAFTMMPLVGALVFFNSKNRLKSLGIWLIPVVMIPLLWPLYSVVVGQTDLYVQWVLWQTGRNKPLSISLTHLIEMDPVIIVIGVAGLIWTGLKRDFFPLLWLVPFLTFSYFIGWVQYFHHIFIFPALCVASAVLIDSVQRFIMQRIKPKQGTKILSQGIFLAVSLFGLLISTILITSDVNGAYFKIYAAIAQSIPDASNDGENQNANVTIIGSHWWVWDSYWINQYVLKKQYNLIDPHFDPNFEHPPTDKVIFVDDQNFLAAISKNPNSGNLPRILQLHDQSSVKYRFFENVTSRDNGVYPNNIFSEMILNENRPIGEVVIKRNFQ